MKKQYISPSNMSPRLPISQAVTCWLFLEYLNAPQWVYGVMGFFYAVVLIEFAGKLIMKKSVDLVDRVNKTEEAMRDILEVLDK